MAKGAGTNTGTQVWSCYREGFFARDYGLGESIAKSSCAVMSQLYVALDTTG